VDPLNRRGWRRRLTKLLAALLLAALGVAGGLWLFQGKLIYLARHYGEHGLEGLPPGLVALRDPHDQTSVVGFYRAPSAGGVPERLWLAFAGNGDLALRYDPVLAPSATATQGFLMVEYPGYGSRRGEPTPESLLRGTEVTLAALAQHLGTTTSELEARSRVLGYSLGSAAALQYAARHPVQRIVLVAPFTSMLEMARRSVGFPLCELLRHRYDNVSALAEIQRRRPTPLVVLHGSADGFIPPEMGRALAAQVPGSTFELVPGAGHGDVVDVAEPQLRRLLAEP
jgi:uncharacterized protein